MGAVTPPLQPFVDGHIWLCSYPVRLPVVEFEARMTVVRLADGRLLLHSPCRIDAPLRQALLALGDVAAIVAPGTFHHLHVASAQAAFPQAKTYLCPGLETKRPDLRHDGVLSDAPPALWAGQLEQVVMRGGRWMSEVAFFHQATRTLILVDLIEWFTDATPDTAWKLRLWWRLLRMWNRPVPAPEYQLGWRDRAQARACLERILEWDFRRIVIAHGDLIERDARSVAERAWKGLLSPRA